MGTLGARWIEKLNRPGTVYPETKSVMRKIQFTVLISLMLIGCHTNYYHAEAKKSSESVIFTGSGNIRIFTWDEGMCYYTGRYDATKVSYDQLRNTLELFSSTDRFFLHYNVTPWYIKENEEMNAESLRNEYHKKYLDLLSVEIIQSPFWTRYRKNKIKELNQVYAYKKITLLAFANPDTLRSINYPKECGIYVDALIDGGQLLLKVWDKLNRDACKVNVDPVRLRRIFEQEYAAADKLKYARIEVMSFGWWNHINNLIPYVDNNHCHDKFIKSFISVKEECEDP